MGTRETDQQLVERAQKGDTRAFDLLVRKYQHKIIGLIGRYVHDHAEVQDVAQEAFIKAYRALGKFRAESAFYTWMYRIAINTAKNHLVSRGRRPPGSDLDIVDAEIVDHSGRLADTETPEAAMAATSSRPRSTRRSTTCRMTCARRSPCASSRDSPTRISPTSCSARWARYARGSSAPGRPSISISSRW
jgi:RNA polymerase sigma factor RpoE